MSPTEIMEVINASIDFDKRMAREDIAGSRAHAHANAQARAYARATRTHARTTRTYARVTRAGGGIFTLEHTYNCAARSSFESTSVVVLAPTFPKIDLAMLADPLGVMLCWSIRSSAR